MLTFTISIFNKKTLFNLYGFKYVNMLIKHSIVSNIIMQCLKKLLTYIVKKCVIDLTTKM